LICTSVSNTGTRTGCIHTQKETRTD